MNKIDKILAIGEFTFRDWGWGWGRQMLNKKGKYIVCEMVKNAKVKNISKEWVQEASGMRVQFKTRWTGVSVGG